jgi:hypothetical protein
MRFYPFTSISHSVTVLGLLITSQLDHVELLFTVYENSGLKYGEEKFAIHNSW